MEEKKIINIHENYLQQQQPFVFNKSQIPRESILVSYFRWVSDERLYLCPHFPALQINPRIKH
jgi:hypothetical protein